MNPHKPPNSEVWLDKAIDELRTTPLPPSVAGQLRAARRTALAGNHSPTRVYWQWGLAASVVVLSVLSLVLWQQSTAPTPSTLATPALVVDDLPIMTAQDELQFYQDLEFIQWLAKDNRGDQG